MNRLIAMILVAALVSCADDPDSSRGSEYLTVAVAPDYASGKDPWIMIHDSGGKLLDSRELKGGEMSTFEAGTLPLLFTVTILNLRLDGEVLKGTISSYLAQNPRQEWTLQSTSDVGYTGPVKGEVTVLIPLNELNTATSHPVLSDGFSSSATYTEFENNARLIKNIFDAGDNLLLIATDVAGQPRYKYLTDVEPGQYSVSINDMETFSDANEISFPPSDDVSLEFRGYENFMSKVEGRGYIIHTYESPEEPTIISRLGIGHLDWLQTYRTAFEARYGNMKLGYQSRGPAADEEIIIKDDFETSITNRDIAAFHLDNGNYSWYQATWSDDNQSPNITWSIYGPANVFPGSAFTLPAEISERYPQLKDMQYDFTEAKLFKGTMTYNLYLGEKFRGGSGDYELFYKAFQ